MSGCLIPLNADNKVVYDCYTDLKKLSYDVENIIGNLKRNLHAVNTEVFIIVARSLKEQLGRCFLPVLEADCDFLISNIQKEKYVICEALMERFGASLIGLAVSFQTNQYRMETMSADNANTSAQKEQAQKVSDETLPVVLAVDDSPEILSILKSILSGRVRFFGLASGTMALKFLQQQKPDLYIFDIDIPGMNGFELAKRACVKESGKPLFYLTSNSNRENLVSALQSGAKDFIVKPCDEKIIVEKIETVLGLKL